ncbi:hypothetical protein [Saccharibacillus sacchari]|uniref:Uncharacterized protein n=1 Tax=Saccharibacillus sacchari TaxID=456493 RepID=A0ACC6P9F2_9BACL
MSKKKWAAAALVLYVFPYASLFMEVHYRGMLLLGGLLIVGITVLLAITARIYGSIYLVLIGNVISAFLSYRFIQNWAGTTGKADFFEPLSTLQALFLYTGILLIAQAVALIVIESLRRRKSRGEKAFHTEA